MYQEGHRHAGEPNTALIPPVYLDIGGVQNVLAENNRVAGRPTQQDNIAGVEARGQKLGLPVHELEVVLLPSILGDSGAELKVDRCTSHRDQHSRNPDEQRESHATRKGQDGARSGEDSGANHAVEDEEDSGEYTDLALRIARDLQLLYIHDIGVSEFCLYLTE